MTPTSADDGRWSGQPGTSPPGRHSITPQKRLLEPFSLEPFSRGVRLCALMACMVLCGCRGRPKPDDPAVGATNSYLECAARDLLGPSARVLRLAEPGMCPGHFDIRPSQVTELGRCRVLFRLDFQKSLDAKLARVAKDGLKIVEVCIGGGLCEPQSYLAACEQTAAALVDAGLLVRRRADSRLAEIRKRVEATAASCRRKAAPLAGLPVLASEHQEAFCRWLRLEPVATFRGADTAAVSQVDEAVRAGERAGAKLVIANFPEGRRLADRLAQRLGATVVVFGNFPALGKGHASFDDLLKDNVDALLEAHRK